MEKKQKEQLRFPTRLVAYTGVATALTFVATLLGFSTAQFYFNLGDSVILITSALLGPVPAMISGGLGSFFADMTVYPATMLYTLFVKGLEGLVSGLLCKAVFRAVKYRALLYVPSALFSVLLMALGYFLFQSFVYGTYAAAIVALPMDVLQGVVSVTLSFVVLFPLKLSRYREKLGMAK